MAALLLVSAWAVAPCRTAKASGALSSRVERIIPQKLSSRAHRTMDGKTPVAWEWDYHISKRQEEKFYGMTPEDRQI